MGTGALTLCCCCCEGKVAGGPLVGGGGGIKKDPIGAYPPSLLEYDGVGDVEDLLKLNTFESEFWKRIKGKGLIKEFFCQSGSYMPRVALLPVSPSMCQTMK